MVYSEETATQLPTENFVKKTQFLKAKRRLECLYRTYPRLFKFPKSLQKGNEIAARPNFEILLLEYECLKERLKNQDEHYVTIIEHEFLAEIKKETKKNILNSCWIGSHCIDLFIPNVRSKEVHLPRTTRGLAIELDGWVHQYEGKQIKDERKSEQLSALGISVTHIENKDYNHKLIKKIRKSLKGLRPMDSRERRRLWTRIHAFTLAIHLNDDEFFQIFKLKNNCGGNHGK